MKIVIVEIKKNTAVALRDDGRFVRLRQGNYQVGQTVGAPAAGARRFPRLAAACVAAAALLSASGVLAAGLPYSYVTMDVNPSIKYTLNIFDRILSVEAINEDADPIVDALMEEKVAYRHLDDVLEMTISECRDDGYIYEDTRDYAVLSVASRSDHKKQKLSEHLGGSDYGAGLVSFQVVPATVDEMKEAEEKGTTPGKLDIIGKMQEKTGDTQPPEQWIDKPVRDIIKAADGEASQEAGEEEPNAPPPSAGSQEAGEPEGSEAAESGQSPGQAAAPETGAETPDDAKAEGASQPAPESGTQAAAADADEEAQKTIDALSQEDKEALEPYIDAYRSALDMEKNAGETGNEDAAIQENLEKQRSALLEAAQDIPDPEAPDAQAGQEGQAAQPSPSPGPAGTP